MHNKGKVNMLVQYFEIVAKSGSWLYVNHCEYMPKHLLAILG